MFPLTSLTFDVRVATSLILRELDQTGAGVAAPKLAQ